MVRQSYNPEHTSQTSTSALFISTWAELIIAMTLLSLNSTIINVIKHCTRPRQVVSESKCLLPRAIRDNLTVQLHFDISEVILDYRGLKIQGDTV